MKRLLLPALALLCGCSTAEKPAKPWEPPTYVSELGASILLLEMPSDFLDDFSNPFQRAPEEIDEDPTGPKPSTNTQSLGQQVLDAIVRKVVTDESKSASVISHGKVDPVNDGKRYSVGLGGGSDCFMLKFKASRSESPGYCQIEWESEFMTGYSVDLGRGGENPEVRFDTKERIAAGACRLPWKASLAMFRHKGNGRTYVLILRLNSLSDWMPESPLPWKPNR